MATKSNCQGCMWWSGKRKVHDDFPLMGDCRISAPVVVQVGDINSGLEYDTAWPRTEARDVCAQWMDAGGEWISIGEAADALAASLKRRMEENQK